jgi:hypothetical protein
MRSNRLMNTRTSDGRSAKPNDLHRRVVLSDQRIALPLRVGGG